MVNHFIGDLIMYNFEELDRKSQRQQIEDEIRKKSRGY